MLAALFVAAWCYVYAYDKIKIVRLDEMFSEKYGWPAGQRNQYFARKFPSSTDIDTYLSDATILFSNPPNGNSVFYFGKDRQFASWYGQGISAGKWSISPHLQIIFLGPQWRTAVVYTFCSYLSDQPTAAQQDNCREVETLDSIFSQGRDTRREYQKSDIFNLQDNEKKLGQLPKTDISISSLLAAKIGGLGSKD